MSMENMDPNAMVRALDKLLDYTASGIGAVAGPMLATWRARREAAALQITAQGQADSLRIIAAAQAEARDALVSTASDVRGDIDIAETVSQRIQFQEEKRHRNIGSVVGRAAEELGDKEVPDQEPDHDWTARFFNYIQDVSSEEMQSLWAKVLAGEVERPGSISVRSLSILRNLDRADAELFQTFRSCCVTLIFGNKTEPLGVHDLGTYAGGNSLETFGLGYDKLNDLNEHGLIISQYQSRRDMHLSVGMAETDVGAVIRVPFEFQGRYWVFAPSEPRTLDDELEFSGIFLTKSGKELASVIEPKPMSAYQEALMNFFAAQNLAMIEVGSPDAQVTQSGVQYTVPVTGPTAHAEGSNDQNP